MEKEEFKKEYGITEEEFCGKKTMERSLMFYKQIDFPKGFKPVLSKMFCSIGNKKIDNDIEIISKQPVSFENVEIIKGNFKVKTGGYLDLRRLKKISKNFHVSVGMSLDLCSLEEIPRYFKPKVDENLYFGGSYILDEELKELKNLKNLDKLETEFPAPNFKKVKGNIICGNKLRFNLKESYRKAPKANIKYYC